MKRRNFVKTLASLAAVGTLPGVAAAAGAATTGAHEGSQGPAALRSYTAARYSLEIDGADVGLLESIEGGHAVSEVISDASGKRLGKLSYEPLRVSLRIPPHADVTKLLGEVAGNGAGRRTVGIVGYDMNMKATSFREFLNAVPTEIAIDKLDAGASKAGISVLITFQAEQMRVGDKGGATGRLGSKAKVASQFRFSVSGLESAAIAAVELPTWKRDALMRTVGDAKGASTTLGKADLTTFTAEITASRAQPWLDWFEQFAILRKDGNERTAKLELLAPDAQTVLYTISLAGVGIAALRSPKVAGNTETIAKLEATLYAERITYGS
jgi:hypothetical protein